MLTKEVKKAILTVPTIPAAKLSIATTNDKAPKYFSVNAKMLKPTFVNKTNKPPIINAFLRVSFFINKPPKKNPAIDANNATTLTIDPISVLEKPISI